MLGRASRVVLNSHPYLKSSTSATLRQSRPYASKNKSPHSPRYQPPSSASRSRHGPNGQRPIPSTAPHSQRPVPIDSAGLEEKFNNIDEQIKSTDQSYPQESSNSPDYSTLQDEFQTSAFSNTNTAPQSDSPSAIDPARAQGRRLPDLTQGIPSTLDAEMEAQSRKSDPQSLDIMEEPSSDGGRSGGREKYEGHVSSLEQKRTRLGRIAYTVLFSTILGTIMWEGRNWETEEEEKRHPEAPSGVQLGLFYKRVKARMNETSEYYTEPTFPKLLPDPDPTWARPYTLVLSMEDLLVHSEWSREHGWRTAKRPGVDYFLRYLSSYYELVIWMDSSIATGQQIYAKFDPYRVVLWPLFREATKYENGVYIKDISYLNRDPKKVIVLDTDPSHVKTQPENAILLPPWTGQPGDKELVSYIHFLEYCASMNYKDLREVLKSFKGEHIPSSYAKREAAIREKVRKQQPVPQGGAKPKKSFLSSLSGGAGGQLIGPDGTELPTYAEAAKQGKTYMDMVRERGQKQYEILDKEIRENGEKWLKEMADDEKRQQDEAMKSMKSSFTSYIPFFGGNRDESTSNQGKSS